MSWFISATTWAFLRPVPIDAPRSSGAKQGKETDLKSHDPGTSIMTARQETRATAPPWHHNFSWPRLTFANNTTTYLSTTFFPGRLQQKAAVFELSWPRRRFSKLTFPTEIFFSGQFVTKDVPTQRSFSSHSINKTSSESGAPPCLSWPGSHSPN